MPEIAENGAGSPHQFEIVVAHRKASLSRFSRSLILSTSICGVLIPLFAFI
jgi:hypothetical protein